MRLRLLDRDVIEGLVYPVQAVKAMHLTAMHSAESTLRLDCSGSGARALKAQ